MCRAVSLNGSFGTIFRVFYNGHVSDAFRTNWITEVVFVEANVSDHPQAGQSTFLAE